MEFLLRLVDKDIILKRAKENLNDLKLDEI
jgi:hypothetical protein